MLLLFFSVSVCCRILILLCYIYFDSAKIKDTTTATLLLLSNFLGRVNLGQYFLGSRKKVFAGLCIIRPDFCMHKLIALPFSNNPVSVRLCQTDMIRNRTTNCLMV